ncbi:hypothetical protein RAA17_00810 [Komagataeibacter rhaeticus]|nr:hypothetical protein [Komagataeibacter rhaeticus]
MLLLGLPLAAVATGLTYMLTRPIMARPFGCTPDIRAVVEEARNATRNHDAADGPARLFMQASQQRPVSIGEIALVIAVPVLLMVGGTLAGELMAPGRLRSVLVFVGIPFIALGLDVVLCAWLLGLRRGMALGTVSDVVAAALPGTAIIILITGAGARLRRCWWAAGWGCVGWPAGRDRPATAGAGLRADHDPARGAGPTTVALMTTAGILGPMIGRLHLDQTHLALMALAMGAGAWGCPMSMMPGSGS